MTHRRLPLVGQWYKDLDSGDLFQVVAVDERSGTVDIQDFEGGLDEFELDEWLHHSLEQAAPPEDWTGPVDDLEPDDLGYSDTGAARHGDSMPEETAGAWRELLQQGDEAFPEEAARHRPTLKPANRRHRPRRH